MLYQDVMNIKTTAMLCWFDDLSDGSQQQRRQIDVAIVMSLHSGQTICLVIVRLIAHSVAAALE